MRKCLTGCEGLQTNMCGNNWHRFAKKTSNDHAHAFDNASLDRADRIWKKKKKKKVHLLRKAKTLPV